jgi:hypothetical protein
MCVVHNPSGIVSSQNLFPVANKPGSRMITHFLILYPRSGRLRMRGSQYPLIRNMNVKNPWTATSGMMYVLRRLQRSIGLM